MEVYGGEKAEVRACQEHEGVCISIAATDARGIGCDSTTFMEHMPCGWPEKLHEKLARARLGNGHVAVLSPSGATMQQPEQAAGIELLVARKHRFRHSEAEKQ